MNNTIKNITIKDMVILALSIVLAVSIYLLTESNAEKRDLRNTFNHLTIHGTDDLKVDNDGRLVKVEND